MVQGRKIHFEIIDGQDFDKLFTSIEAIVKYNEWHEGLKFTIEVDSMGDFCLRSNGKCSPE